MTDTPYFRLQLVVFALVTASFTNIYITQPVLPVLQKEFSIDTVLVSVTISAVILGIDEYTACTTDLGGECRVMGVGRTTIRQQDRDDRCYRAGDSFALDELKATRPFGEPTTVRDATVSERSIPWIDWPDTPEDDTESVTSFIDLLVRVRARLRAAEQWALADEIRQQLAELGVILEDGQTETTWRRG